MSTNQEFGDYELILGNEDNNTLTGTDTTNIFVHQGATNDLIKDFDPSEDIIVLTAGKVSESMNSSNGNDVIFKIAAGNDDLGTITIQDGRGKFCTVYDADYINKSKNDFLEFSNLKLSRKTQTLKVFLPTAQIARCSPKSKPPIPNSLHKLPTRLNSPTTQVSNIWKAAWLAIQVQMPTFRKM